MENNLTIKNDQVKELQSDLEEVKDSLLREIQGIKTTLDVLQDKEVMETIEESDRLLKEGVKPEEFIY
ncbi:hypothetical protein CMI38_01290 [Candidatus Pacearchaeota archaeon]|jgi:hypothetical protein|nr:hypothetical protein [Candidatus Pacearchaeota archaeon]|tara:strand:- start:1167 stop:1370 length:204 start_codon:yes stop_codon:yes gene_type:complete